MTSKILIRDVAAMMLSFVAFLTGCSGSAGVPTIHNATTAPVSVDVYLGGNWNVLSWSPSLVAYSSTIQEGGDWKPTSENLDQGLSKRNGHLVAGASLVRLRRFGDSKFTSFRVSRDIMELTIQDEGTLKLINSHGERVGSYVLDVSDWASDNFR